LSFSWLSQLQPASWRGIPFSVNDSEIRRGRRTAVHEYAYRDIVWVEDLGLATRRYGFRGFFVGDDCYAVEQSMLAAAETPGPGQLVHPSLGALTVSLIEFSSGQRRELGRVVEFQFGFIEGSPGALSAGAAGSTQDTVSGASDEADAASQGDFFDGVGGALATGAAVVGQAVATVGGFVASGLAVVNDASRLVNSVRGLGSLIPPTVSLGRFSGGNIIPSPTSSFGQALATVSGITSTVARVEAGATALIGNAINLGAAATFAGANVINLAESL
jgi:prophage DNA circulation protein